MWQCKYCDSWNSDEEKFCPVCDKSRQYSYVMTLTKKRADKLGLTGEIVVPKDFNVIGKGAFKSRADITAVILHSGVTKIEQEAFSGCVNLKEVKCEGELVSISSKAFANCLSLDPKNYPSASRFTAKDAFFINAEISRMDKLIASLNKCVHRYQKIKLSQETRGADTQETQDKIIAITEKISEAKTYKINLARGVAEPYNIVLYASIVSSEVGSVYRAEEEETSAAHERIERTIGTESKYSRLTPKSKRRIRNFAIGIAVGAVLATLITILLVILL